MHFFNILLLFLIFQFANGHTLKDFKLEHVRMLDESNYENFINYPQVRTVYFYEPLAGLSEAETKEKLGTLYDGRFAYVLLEDFLPVYEKSAEYLQKHDIEVAIVDCTKTPNLGYCGDPEKNNVFIYALRDGKKTSRLLLENMSVEDGAIGSLLHLNVIKIMPIINSEEKIRERVLIPNRGKKDVLLGYFKYLGDPEHRAFVESAYPYLNDFAWVLVTDKETFEKASFYRPLQKDDDSKVILFQCKETKEDGECPHFYFKGTLDASNSTLYMKNLKEVSKTFDVPDDGNLDQLGDRQVHKAYLFYDATSKVVVKKAGDKLRNNFPGELGVLTINTELVDVKKEFEHTLAKIPACAVELFGQKKPKFMTHRFSEANAIQFTNKLIEEQHRERMKKDQLALVSDERIDPTQVMDDEVASPVYNLGLLPQSQFDMTRIAALTDKTFPMTTQRDFPTLVVFYTKYDPTGMAFMRSFSMVTKSEQDMTAITRVNCFDWTDVCQKEKVHKFPTLRVYQAGRQPVLYRGMLDGEAVLNFLKVLQLGTPMKLDCPEKTKLFMSSDYMYPAGLKGLQFDATVAVGLTREEDVPVVKEVADMFGGEMFFAYGSDDVANIMCSDGMPPCAVVMVPHEPKKTIKLEDDGKLDAGKLTEQIKAHRLPAMPELTVMNLPKIFSRKRPLLLLFDDLKDKEYQTVEALARSGEFNDHIFAWVNCMEVDGTGINILHTYSPDTALPALARVDVEKGEVHMFDKNDIMADAIKVWIKKIIGGGVKPVYILPNIKWKPRNEGYDFLTKADQRIGNTTEGGGGRLRGAKHGHEDGNKMASPEGMQVKVADDDGKAMDGEKTMDMGMKTTAHEEL